MATNSKQLGDVVPYTNDTGSDIAVNQLVPMKGVLGVALVDIPNGESGNVQITEVWEVPKVAGTALETGDAIDYDASEGAVTTGLTPATGDITKCAMAFKPAAAGATTCEIRLGFPGGTVN